MNQQHMDQQMALNELLKDATDTACSCGNIYFTPAINLKRVSALISPTKQEELAQMGVLLCSKCGTKFERPTIIS
jgi:hypothetical protein